MLKIGTFSKLSRISVRMLRRYDEVGLLRPAETDPQTGYRFYRESQLPRAALIVALRDMGFGIAAIAQVIDAGDDPARLDALLSRRRVDLAAQVRVATLRLRRLDALLDRIRKETPVNYQVTLKTIPERYAACVRTVISRYEDEGQVWATLCRETEPLGVVPDDPCLCSAVFFDDEYREADVDLEVQKTVRGTYPDTEHVRFKTLPATLVACATFKGGYEQVGEVYAAVASWVEENGYAYTGEMFNIYHVSPAETADPAEYVTEVCYPVERRNG